MKTLIPLLFILLIACKSNKPCSAYTLNQKSMSIENIKEHYQKQLDATTDSMEIMGIKMEMNKAIKEGAIPEVTCSMEEGCENCGS